MRYVCLLRGINVGGKNKLSMAELRLCFEKIGFTNVSTYINSGNVLFDAPVQTVEKLILVIETAIENTLSMKLRVTVISCKELKAVVLGAPKEWGHDVNRKHNLLFIRPPVSTHDAIEAIGQPKSGLETVTEGDGVIYWSTDLKQFGKTASSKLASKPIYQDVTVRNYNTALKLYTLTNETL